MPILHRSPKPLLSGDRWRIFNGDCTKVMETLGKYDLILADPPFNLGQSYNGYDDKKKWWDYVDFTLAWRSQAEQQLRPGGVLCIHVPDAVARVLLGGDARMFVTPVDWIIWHYRFGQSGKASKASRCITSKAHLLVWAANGAKHTFNAPMVPSDRATKYKDKRTLASDTPGMRVAFDVWGVEGDGPYWGRVQGDPRNKERWDIAHGALVDHPNQLPEVYVKRIIETYSNKGDTLLCPFGGSGTETVVALALGRSIDTIEISELGCKSIAKRIQRGAVRV